MEHGYAIYAFVFIVVIVVLSLSFNDTKSSWYKSLNKPPGLPPDWIFTVVWSFLYVMLLIGVLIATWNECGDAWNIICMYSIILLLTLFWIIIFRNHYTLLGVIVLLTTLILTLYMMSMLTPNKIRMMGIGGGAEYVPIIFYSFFGAWLICAIYLNLGIVIMN